MVQMFRWLGVKKISNSVTALLLFTDLVEEAAVTVRFCYAEDGCRMYSTAAVSATVQLYDVM